MKPRILSAIVRRELASYFASPTGYVFITIFIFLSAFAAFWLPDFFNRNIASLDQLNLWFPALLLMLVPAITMGAWAEERRQGTEELLLTLPARDWQLVLGKYLACLLIYTAALLFSVSHVLVLRYLGRPDLGLMLATYLGYWLAGAGLIAVGLVASAVTTNLTVSFILAAVLCGVVVGAGALASIFPGTTLATVAQELSLPRRFADFGRGVVAAENVAYFLLLACFGLWLNTLLVSRHHWSGSKSAAPRSILAIVRAAAIVVAAASLITLLSRTTARADATAEKLWSLSEETRDLIREVREDRPVLITAYLSPKVPASYIQARETLTGLLRELDQAEGGARIVVKIVDTEPFTDAAREAKRNFNIEPREVPPSPEDDQDTPREVFMGLAFTCGGEQFVLPFLSRGLPVEYELARSIRTVSLTSRKKIGIVETEAGVFGSFDFNTFTSKPDWPITGELRKQYEVIQVGKGSPPPDDLDILLVAQPSTLTDEEFAPILDYIKNGKPTLIFEDPLPMVNPGIATSEPRGAGMNPFQRQRMPQQQPKANLAPLWDLLAAEVPPTKVLWDGYNPRPGMGFEREIIFIGRNSGSQQPFNQTLPMTSGLQELVVLMSGEVVTRSDATAKGLTVTPLLHTSPVSGYVVYHEVFKRGFFGIEGFNRARKQVPSTGGHTIGAWIKGTLPAPPPPPAKEGEPAPPPPASISVNVVLLPDLDIVSPEFFRLREAGMADFNFDNVTFILNVVDTMAGDESLVELRKRRPAYRTLERLDEARRTLEMNKDTAVDKATNEANTEIAAANEALRRKVAEIETRTDLDDTTRQIMIESVRTAEQRRVEVQTAAINDKKDAAITEARTKAKEEIEAVQTKIRVAAVALPPVPALALAAVVFLRRRAREREGVIRERLK
jgi:ABC-2 type transport system permease protein